MAFPGRMAGRRGPQALRRPSPSARRTRKSIASCRLNRPPQAINSPPIPSTRISKRPGRAINSPRTWRRRTGYPNIRGSSAPDRPTRNIRPRRRRAFKAHKGSTARRLNRRRLPESTRRPSISFSPERIRSTRTRRARILSIKRRRTRMAGNRMVTERSPTAMAHSRHASLRTGVQNPLDNAHAASAGRSLLSGSVSRTGGRPWRGTASPVRAADRPAAARSRSSSGRTAGRPQRSARLPRDRSLDGVVAPQHGAVGRRGRADAARTSFDARPALGQARAG